MSKTDISKLFLYRYRFYIGYILLSIAFVALLFILPLISPNGLSTAEMQSTVDSYNLHFSSITSGDLVDLPYHILQKICILFFGFSIYSIKLPSIIIGLFLGLLLILLLNRWFKSNVALLASILTVLSVPFLYLAGSGTPLIMLVFWPTFLLWLGSKIQGVKKPRPLYCFVFAFALLLSIFTPHLIYLAIFIILFAIVQPHLRFTIKTLPKFPLILTILIILGGASMLLINIISNPSVALSLFFAENFNAGDYLNNIKTAIAPYFSWGTVLEGVYLSPLIGLATFAIALTGLFSTRKGFFASRNSIATYLIIFTLLLSGLNPDSSLLLLLPLSILIAHGLRYILEKWYGLFPENPYARILAIAPISLFLGIIIISDLSHYIFGYRYSPAVANQFNDDITLVSEELDESVSLLLESGSLEYQFYQVYEDRTHNIKVVDKVPNNLIGPLATIGKWSGEEEILLPVSKIITSPKSYNSDRIYVYNISDTEE